MPNFGYVTVYSRSGSELRTSPSINLSSYTIDSFLTYMAEQGGPDYITTVSISLGGTAVSGSENLSNLTGGSTLYLYDVTPYPEVVTGFFLDGQEYVLGGGGGGDVMVSSQPNNILTSGMKIWAGSQSDYEGLGTYDNNTVYLTI